MPNELSSPSLKTILEVKEDDDADDKDDILDEQESECSLSVIS